MDTLTLIDDLAAAYPTSEKMVKRAQQQDYAPALHSALSRKRKLLRRIDQSIRQAVHPGGNQITAS